MATVPGIVTGRVNESRILGKGRDGFIQQRSVRSAVQQKKNDELKGTISIKIFITTRVRILLCFVLFAIKLPKVLIEQS
jgi:hypothetical protein